MQPQAKSIREYITNKLVISQYLNIFYKVYKRNQIVSAEAVEVIRDNVILS